MIYDRIMDLVSSEETEKVLPEDMVGFIVIDWTDDVDMAYQMGKEAGRVLLAREFKELLG